MNCVGDMLSVSYLQTIHVNTVLKAVNVQIAAEALGPGVKSR